MHVELPVSLVEIIVGVSDDIERLSGEASLLIIQAVMKGEVNALAGPKGKHDPHREATRWTKQRGYVVMAGNMRLRWTAAGLLMAEKQFRRIRGCRLMPRLLAVLDQEISD